MCGRYELKTKFQGLPSLIKHHLPQGFEENYAQQKLIKPADPVVVLKDEGTLMTSIMLWGFIPSWSKEPFKRSTPRPFNARVETLEEKKLFRESWRHKRCLLPASGFLEKGYRIKRKDSHPFWLAGIWSRWMSRDGSELESCCVLTTQSNTLLNPIHNRMPVIIERGSEEEWVASVKDQSGLASLRLLLNEWNPKEWLAEPINKKPTSQMSLF